MSGPLEYLPQGDEIWLFLVRKANGFLEHEKLKKQLRPYMVLLFEIAPKTELYYQEILAESLGEYPSKSLVWNILEDAMKTDRETAPAHRPRAVIFTSDKLYKELAKPLWDNGIQIKKWTEEENQGFGDEYVTLLSKKFREKQALSYKTSALKPGLSIALKTKDRQKTFYEATAELFKAAPWKEWTKMNTVFILSWPEAGTRLFFFYPVKNEDIRIGIETNPAELQHLFTNGERLTLDEGVPGAYHRCLLFTDDFSLPFDDLHDIERYDFKLGADPEQVPFVYPFPICFRKDMASFFRPPLSDFEWMEVGSHALANFTKNYEKLKEKQDEDGVIKKVEYVVPLYNRHTTIYVTLIPFKEWEHLKKVWEEVVVPEREQVDRPSLEASEHDPNACRVCKMNKGPLQRCGQCKLKLYCSKECQAKDWPSHKKVCSPPPKKTDK